MLLEFIRSPLFPLLLAGAAFLLWRRKPQPAPVESAEESSFIMAAPTEPVPPTSQQAFDALHQVDARLEFLGVDPTVRKNFRNEIALLLLEEK